MTTETAETTGSRQFNAYDKRVTLNLALHSAAVAEKPELRSALAKLPELNWDVYKLPQESIEVIYAEFDADLEAKVKDEFEADPAFLVDLAPTFGTCPLCGHEGIRWLFKIRNLKGGQDIECGSECIIVHGLHVKGAETAEHARKALETAIRRRMRELLIQKWHIDFDFKPEQLEALGTALSAIRKAAWDTKDYEARRAMQSAFYKLRDLAKLQRFYDRNGWLGTETRWAEWTRLARFARQFNEACRATIPFPKPWPAKVAPVEAPVSLSATGMVVSDPPTTLAPVPAPEPAPAPVAPAPEPVKEEPKQLALDFGTIAQALVFG